MAIVQINGSQLSNALTSILMAEGLKPGDPPKGTL